MGQPPARSKLTRKQTKAYAEAKDDKPKDEAEAEVKVEEAAKDEDKAEAAVKSEAVVEAAPESLPPEAKVELPTEDVVDAMTKGSTAEAMGMEPPSKTVVEAAAHPPSSSVESPASLPAPKDVPTGEPGDPAPAPGRVPPGDSRSLRYGNLFALIYRHQTFLITRSGTVGNRGVWKVVEYPTTASASNGYAKEASRFVSEGFTDYRD